MVELLFQILPVLRNVPKGQTLIEVLIALGSAVTIIIAIAGATVVALNNAQFSKNQVLATQHNQEGIEFMRKLRDTNWSTFSGYAAGTYCFDQNASTLRFLASTISNSASVIDTCGTNVANNTANKFIRAIIIETNSSHCQPANSPAPAPTLPPTNARRITVITKWTDSKCITAGNLYCHNTIQTTCLSDFTVLPTL